MLIEDLKTCHPEILTDYPGRGFIYNLEELRNLALKESLHYYDSLTVQDVHKIILLYVSLESSVKLFYKSKLAVLFLNSCVFCLFTNNYINGNVQAQF